HRERRFFLGERAVTVGQVNQTLRFDTVLLEPVERRAEVGAAAPVDLEGDVVLGLEYVDVSHARVAVDHVQLGRPGLFDDAADLRTELVEFLLTDGAGGVDYGDDLARALALAGRQVQALCDEATVTATPREVVVGLLGHEPAQDVAPRQHGRKHFFHHAGEVAGETAGLLGDVRGLRHGGFPVGLFVALLRLAATVGLAVGAVLDTAVAARVVVLLLVVLLLVVLLLVVLRLLPASATTASATTASVTTASAAGDVGEQRVDVLGGHSFPLRVAIRTFRQVESGGFQNRVDGVVAGLIPLLEV